MNEAEMEICDKKMDRDFMSWSHKELSARKLYDFWLYIMNYDPLIHVNAIFSMNSLNMEGSEQKLKQLEITCPKCHRIIEKYDRCGTCNYCIGCCVCNDEKC